MPFETGAGASKKVAVVGAGISGMGAAYMLADTHQVTLIEAGARLGGHARTIVAGKNSDQPVDTGLARSGPRRRKRCSTFRHML